MTAFSADASAQVGDARLQPLAFQDLAGWPQDDHGAAFAAFRRGCEVVLGAQAPLRAGQAPDAALAEVCRKALAAPKLSRGKARAFFESQFVPYEIVTPSGRGFLTGYFEPEFVGSRIRTGPYQVPLLARPDDLVTVPQGETLPGLPPGLQAARRTATGYEPYPDRAAIEGGALTGSAKPLVYLREPGEVFIIHVQGSARIRLPDGAAMRVAYAGRNGHPYTSIGRLLVEMGEMTV
jgi:membrane-bound lytic murein transglycosylase A